MQPLVGLPQQLNPQPARGAAPPAAAAQDRPPPILDLDLQARLAPRPCTSPLLSHYLQLALSMPGGE